MKNKIIMGVTLAVLCCGSNNYAYPAHNGLFTGVCTVGAAALLGVGIAAAAGYFAETDDQFIIRMDNECRSIEFHYGDVMRGFENDAGVYAFPVDTHFVCKNSAEIVLYNLATAIWNTGTTQYSYRSTVWSTKKQLKALLNDLGDRIYALEIKNCNYDELNRLYTMRTLFKNGQELLAHVVLLAEFLEYHKSYCNLYETVGTIRNKYVNYLAIAESQLHTDIIIYNFKYAIISTYGGNYPFKNFVSDIEYDISRLRSSISLLTCFYDSGRRYANFSLDQLIWMKNTVVIDPRYQRELYEWEQAHLQRLHTQAIEAHANAEWHHTNAILEQNRILDYHNVLKQSELRQDFYDRCNGDTTDLNISVNICC